jgi:hypothetical protein
MHTQNSTDTNSIETAVVNQPPNRLGMDAELPGDFADAVEAVGLRVDGHGPAEALHGPGAVAP